jgi:outer membrane biosynthesis protein TonB
MPSRLALGKIAAFLLAASLCFAGAGCGEKKVQAASPAPVAPVPSAELERPMTIAPDTTATPPTEPVSPPPAVSAHSSDQPPVAVPKTKPPRPPKPASSTEQQAEPAADQPAHPPAPQISPQLSPGDQASFQRHTTDDISAAEKNLQQASGKQLSAAQRDLYEKIQSFLSQSRDASKAGDLARAQNLAQKARLLSVELVNSL